MDRLGNYGFATPGSDSNAARSVLQGEFPGHAGTEVFVTATARSADFNSNAARLRVRVVSAEISHRLRGMPSVLAVESIATRTADVGRHRETLAVQAVRFDLTPAATEKRLPAVRRSLEGVGGRSVQIALVGSPPISERVASLAREDLARAETIALPLTFAVLILAFVSLTAAAIPLALAATAFATTFAGLFILSTWFDINIFVTNTASVLALGLSIDYSLFMVTRFREEMRKGCTVPEAVAQTMATTGRAVALSGATVAAVMASLFAVGLGLFSSMALGGALAAVLAVLAAITLLPAIICLAGSRLDWLAIAPVERAARRGGLWRSIARVVAARPRLVAVASCAGLAVLAIPALALPTSAQTVSALPSDDPLARQLVQIAAVFGAGATGPIDIVTRQDLSEVRPMVSDAPGVRMVWRSDAGRGGWSSLQVILDGPPDGDGALATVERLRTALAASERRSHVGGLTAETADLTRRVAERTWLVVLVAALFALVALARGLRSILIPVKAVLSTLLSVGATLGILLLLFPSDPGNPSIEFFVPLFLFGVVFGLSLDYEIFLLSRIREEVMKGFSTSDAVECGLVQSGRSITLAGIALATVFVTFGTASLDAFAQLGVGVAVAVVIDVTIVRCLLVPALTIVFGRWNWWYPGQPIRRPVQDA